MIKKVRTNEKPMGVVYLRKCNAVRTLDPEIIEKTKKMLGQALSSKSLGGSLSVAILQSSMSRLSGGAQPLSL